MKKKMNNCSIASLKLFIVETIEILMFMKYLYVIVYTFSGNYQVIMSTTLRRFRKQKEEVTCFTGIVRTYMILKNSSDIFLF